VKERLSTLYLDANGVGSRVILADTVLRGIFGYGDGDQAPYWLRRVDRVTKLFALLQDINARLSYSADWREAFLASPALDVEVCNINNLVHLGRCLLRLRKYDLIIVSHVAAGDDMALPLKIAPALQRRRAPIITFLGNEYDLLDEKIRFLREVGCEYVCTQLPLATGHYLYGECDTGRIVEMPHALNPEHYYPIPDARRDTDIGFIGDIYWPFIGDRERTEVIEWFERHGEGRGLRCDIRKERLPRDEWHRFLNGCNALIGAESGTYYLNDRGRLLDRARHYNLFEDRAASFEDVFGRFYRGQTPEISGKCISSRHFEPIGTKTCQILLEGHYNGILEADRHYIAIRKDFRNIDEVIERYRDAGYRKRMIEETYDYVMSQHTYRHRVEHLLRVVTGTSPSSDLAPAAKLHGPEHSLELAESGDKDDWRDIGISPKSRA
jgi:hypothetical protein